MLEHRSVWQRNYLVSGRRTSWNLSIFARRQTSWQESILAWWFDPLIIFKRSTYQKAFNPKAKMQLGWIRIHRTSGGELSPSLATSSANCQHLWLTNLSLDNYRIQVELQRSKPVNNKPQTAKGSLAVLSSNLWPFLTSSASNHMPKTWLISTW